MHCSIRVDWKNPTPIRGQQPFFGELMKTPNLDLRKSKNSAQPSLSWQKSRKICIIHHWNNHGRIPEQVEISAIHLFPRTQSRLWCMNQMRPFPGKSSVGPLVAHVSQFQAVAIEREESSTRRSLYEHSLITVCNSLNDLNWHSAIEHSISHSSSRRFMKSSSSSLELHLISVFWHFIFARVHLFVPCFTALRHAPRQAQRHAQRHV